MMDIKHNVTVKLLFFAQSKELAGIRETTIRLPAKLSYQTLLNLIAKSYNLETIKHNILLAKNEIVCDQSVDVEVNEKDSIAVIPPLSVLNLVFKMDHLKLTVDVLSVDAISDLVLDNSCGAVSIFVGTTRDNFEGKKVVRLEYEAYESMALKAMKSICDEVREKWPEVHSIAIYHRLGEVPCREASVVIAVSSPHRRAALEAVALSIERLKASVPIWKKEVYEGAAPQWKENQECPPEIPQHPHNKIDKSLVQINVSNEELEKRMRNFIERKREQVNVSNIQDFTPEGAGETGDTESCARVRMQFVRRSDSKGHLKIRKVHNEWGPQTVQPRPLPAAVAERVAAVEQFLRVPPVAPDVYRRLKVLEDRIADLQAVSPEYAHFWKNKADDVKQESVDYEFTAEDIERKIEMMERQGLS